MKCLHCSVEYHDDKATHPLGEDATSDWTLIKRVCPSCKKFIFSLKELHGMYSVGGVSHYHHSREHNCYPKRASRIALSPEVPESFAEGYKEACLTLSDSPKASAALSRRCLQHVLRDVAKVKPGNLAGEIQAVIDSSGVPSYISESLDAVRNIGNFAAHPMKSKSSGEIIDVEPGEAEWNLDVLESLFDFYFVQPALIQKKRDALNVKLKDAGKPELK